MIEVYNRELCVTHQLLGPQHYSFLFDYSIDSPLTPSNHGASKAFRESKSDCINDPSFHRLTIPLVLSV